MSIKIKAFYIVIGLVVANHLFSWLLSLTKSGYGLLEDFLINETFLEPRVRVVQPPKGSLVHDGMVLMQSYNVSIIGVGRNLGSRLQNVLGQVYMRVYVA